MEGDGANGHPLRVHVSRDYNIFTATGARSRWPSLILFSLDGIARSRKNTTMKEYTAPWSTSLIFVSSIATLICMGAAISAARSGRPWIALLPLAIVCGGILFTIRGYTVTPDALLVHRLFWATRLPLSGLHSAQVEPEAMRRSIRTFGNGGLFSFTGWFRNTTLG